MKQLKGFIAISTVLIISVVVLAISVVVTFSSIGDVQSSLAIVKGVDSLNLVEGCVENALFQIRANSSYSGGTISVPEGSCTINIISVVGSTWTLDTASTDVKYSHTIRVVLNRNSTGISLVSWKEI